MSKEYEYDFSDGLVSVDGHSIIINYDQIFNQEGLETMNEYHLKKRSYNGIIDMIYTSIVRLFNDNQEKAVLPFLEITYNVKDHENDYPVESLKDDIIKKLLCKSTRKSIDNFVRENYIEVMDENTKQVEKTKNNVNKELQFTDEHVKILLKISEAIRISIPIVSLFCEERDEEPNDTFYYIFSAIIRSFQGNIKITNKLHRFIYSRVVNTQYSDKTIWNVLTNKSQDVNVITMEYLKDVVNTILPKIEMEKNSINYIHVVIKQKLGFEFSKDFPINFKPVNLNQVDSEGLTPFDKWEISMIKKNESKITINKVSIKQQIHQIAPMFGIVIPEEEFEYYKKVIKINPFQTNILFLFWARFVGSYQNLYNCDYNEYIYLLITLYKWMNENGFENLAYYLIGTPDKLNEKRINNTKSKICAKVNESKEFNNLLENKFKFISKNIIESNIITKIIGNLSVSKFLQTIPYESSDEDLKPEDLEELGNFIKVETLASELLNFLSLV